MPFFLHGLTMNGGQDVGETLVLLQIHEQSSRLHMTSRLIKQSIWKAAGLHIRTPLVRSDDFI